MPTYEYACKSCEEHLEVVQSFKDEPLTECPNCGGPLRKVFGNIGIAFKGSGFYKTDSRSGAKPSKSSEKPAAASSDSSGSGSSSGSESSSGSGAGSGSGSGSGASGSSTGSSGSKSSESGKSAKAS